MAHKKVQDGIIEHTVKSIPHTVQLKWESQMKLRNENGENRNILFRVSYTLFITQGSGHPHIDNERKEAHQMYHKGKRVGLRAGARWCAGSGGNTLAAMCNIFASVYIGRSTNHALLHINKHHFNRYVLIIECHLLQKLFLVSGRRINHIVRLLSDIRERQGAA